MGLDRMQKLFHAAHEGFPRDALSLLNRERMICVLYLDERA
jgi:hypothetical protein